VREGLDLQWGFKFHQNLWPEPAKDTAIAYGTDAPSWAEFFTKGGVVSTAITADPVKEGECTGIVVVQAKLTELPLGFQSDYAFCADTLDKHWPLDVALIVNGIAAQTKKGAYFHIPLNEDEPDCAHRWMGIIGRSFGDVRLLENQPTFLTISAWHTTDEKPVRLDA